MAIIIRIKIKKGLVSMNKEMFKYNILSQAKNCSPLIPILMRLPYGHRNSRIFPYLENMHFYSKEHNLCVRFIREDEHISEFLCSVQFKDENMDEDDWTLIQPLILDKDFKRDYLIEKVTYSNGHIVFSLDSEFISVQNDGTLFKEVFCSRCSLIFDLNKGKFTKSSFGDFFKTIDSCRDNVSYYFDLEISDKVIKQIDKNIRLMETKCMVSPEIIQKSKRILWAIQNSVGDNKNSRLSRIIQTYRDETKDE